MSSLSALSVEMPSTEVEDKSPTLRYLNAAAASHPTTQAQGDGTPETSVDPLVALSEAIGERRVVELPVFAKRSYLPTEYFAALQEWEGVVREVTENGFIADLYDIGMESSGPTQIAEIAFADLDRADRNKAKPGAIFRWLVGRSRARTGRSSGKRVVYFRPAIKSNCLGDFDGLDFPAELLTDSNGSEAEA